MSEQSRRVLDQVVGHRRVVERLLKTVEADRLPPSWLFIGAKNQGKKMVALGVAQAFLCERSRAACGACPACLRVANRQSEGLILVEPEGAVIKIETARQIVNSLSLSALGRGRVVIIDDAEKLGAQAGNALLKSIEEPPPRTHFILLTTSRDAVLGTIRSRSQVVRFGLLTHEEHAAIGREDLDSETRGQASEDLREVLLGSPQSAISRLRERVNGREAALLYFKLWLETLRDAWAHGNNFESVSRARLSTVSELIVRAERDIQGNCDVALTLENLVYGCHVD